MMDERRIEQRHRNSEIPYELCNIYLILPDGTEVITKLVDMSSFGMRIIIPTDEYCTEQFPVTGGKLYIHFPVKGINIPAECIYYTRNPNGTVTVGVNFINQYHQNIFSEIISINRD